MGKLLKLSSTEQYVEKGYYHPIDALTREEAAICLAHLERYESKIGQPIDGKYRHKPHLLFPWLHDLISHPRVLDAVEDVLGPNILCWGSSFFIKEPEDPGYVSWHQDATYWGLDRPDVCTAWIALTPSTRANGCMRVASGSHGKQITHTDTFHKDNLLSRGQEINAEVDEKDAVDLELSPGQMSLHHVRIIHGSNPNPTKTRRPPLTISPPPKKPLIRWLRVRWSLTSKPASSTWRTGPVVTVHTRSFWLSRFVRVVGSLYASRPTLRTPPRGVTGVTAKAFR